MGFDINILRLKSVIFVCKPFLKFLDYLMWIFGATNRYFENSDEYGIRCCGERSTWI
jgi:hypothetical protein